MTDIEFLLPDVGEGLAEATISSWLVAEGSAVTRMEPMVEVETAKSTVDIPSPVDGIMLRHGASVGETLDVGTSLAVLRVPDGDKPLAPPVSAPSAAVTDQMLSSEPLADVATSASMQGAASMRSRVRGAPTVRRRAYQAGVDLADVKATGDGGRILMSDLERFLSVANSGSLGSKHPVSFQRAGGIQSEHSQVLSPMRSAIFETLSKAWASVPLITDLREVDATELKRLRPILLDEVGHESRLTYTALFCAVVIGALRRHPELNIWFDANLRTITYKEHINLGVAVSVPGGLSVGVVHEAEKLTMAELSKAIDDLAERARGGKLLPSEVNGATVTVTSFGTYGGWFGTPLVIPPQAVIIGFGAIKDRAVAVDGQVVVRPIAPLSVSADHRVIDGAELSVFCSTVERLLAEPARMVVT